MINDLEHPITFISIGGNISPHEHIKNALTKINEDFSNIETSSIYESESVGFVGPNFLNLVVSFTSHLSLGELNNYLHAIEDIEGRDRVNGKACDSRTLDLDIVLFGEMEGIINGIELPRAEILESAHVLLPLAEIAGDRLHKPTNMTYSDLCQKMDFSQQKIWQTEL